jgi:hypothetical protein
VKDQTTSVPEAFFDASAFFAQPLNNTTANARTIRIFFIFISSFIHDNQ